jgi:hypothetical protein
MSDEQGKVLLGSRPFSGCKLAACLGLLLSQHILSSVTEIHETSISKDNMYQRVASTRMTKTRTPAC